MASEHKHTHSNAMAVFSPGTPFRPWNFELHPLGSNDVEVKITHCGVCHSDLHTVDGDWGPQPYPVVPGHEIIGFVTQVGPAVKDIKVGMRVGVGPQALSCRSCHFCNDGQETFCEKGFIGTYCAKLEDGYITKGGYALYHRTDAHFAIPIPENLDSAKTAPLLCAAVTVYTPLRHSNVKPGVRVAVIGIGGLGHMALQLAHAMGAEVTAISSSLDKEAEAKALGASEFFYSKSSDEDWAKLKGKFDVVLNTTNVQLDWPKYLNTVRSRGAFFVLSGAPGLMSFKNFDLISRGIKVEGSLIGPPGYIKDMLDLCSRHGIGAVVETLPLSQVNEACDKVRKNLARHRMVLVMPTDQ